MTTSTRTDGGIEVPIVSSEPVGSPVRDPDRTVIAYPVERFKFGARRMPRDKTKPTTPAGLTATVVSPTTVDLAWQASTDPGQGASGVRAYRVFRGGQRIAEVSALAWTDTTCTPSTTYSYQVASVDHANNQSMLSPKVRVALPAVPDAPDTTAPSTPTGLNAVTQGETQINLTWTISSDPLVPGQAQSGVVGYKVRRDGAQVATVALVPSYQDTGLNPGTLYSYTVSAVDAAGNESAQSAAATATTTAPGLDPDTTAPTVPTNLVATPQSASTINVTWSASTDPSVGGQETSGLAGYRLRRGGSVIASPGLVTAYLDSGLAASTQYSYTLAARDAAGNESAETAPATATTDTAGGGGGTGIVAASASQSDVQAAINSAVDGDTVLIPNGSATWSGGITTTKQIRVRAQNYTPTFRGTMTRSVTITNNSGGPLFAFTTGNTHSVGIAGIRFNEGSGAGNAVRFQGSGTKVPLMNDCSFEVKDRFGNARDAAVISVLCQGAVFWNLYLNGVGNPGTAAGASLYINSPRAWTTASTMGAADTGGVVNVYVEDSTFKNISAAPDTDDNGRYVCRYSLLDGTWGITHGFSSAWGGRHFEYYNNTFSVTTPARNMARRYFWCRAGTGLFTDNVVNETSDTSSYGPIKQLDIGDSVNPSGSYPIPRQPGGGHNGSNYITDPIYLWNQSGAKAYSWGVQSNWSGYIIENRDIFVNNGAKPGYSKYAYPHPLRS